MSWLYGSMEQQVLDLLLQSPETSKELWEDLKIFYRQQKNHSHVYCIKQEIQLEKRGTRSHLEYLSSLKKKFDELKIYRPFTTDPKELRKRQAEDDIFQYLSSFDSSYEVIRSQIIRAPDLPSFVEVVSQIQREDSLWLAMGGPQAGHGEGHELHGHAVKNPQNSSFQNHQNRPNSKKEKCSHCKKEGHKVKRCFFLHPHLKPKWWIEAEPKRGGHGDWNEGKKEKERERQGMKASPHRPDPTL